jgi:hypothetical protein
MGAEHINQPEGSDPNESLETEVAAGRSTRTPFLLLGGVALIVWLTAALIAGVILVIWLVL